VNKERQEILSKVPEVTLSPTVAAEPATHQAVYLHRQAADELVRSGTGPIGLTASEVIESARHILNHWVYADTPWRWSR
jgi:NAD(P)H-hydrate repair Nnr-like enzyme with NAD(P)H-hydrate dehydratase domain